MIFVLVCVLTAVLFVWGLLAFSGRAFGEFTMPPRADDVLGPASARLTPPGGQSAAPASGSATPAPAAAGATTAAARPAAATTTAAAAATGAAARPAAAVTTAAAAPAPMRLLSAAMQTGGSLRAGFTRRVGALAHTDAGNAGADRRPTKATSRTRARATPSVDLGANGARVESVDKPGEVRVISRTRRPSPTVEPAPTTRGAAADSDAGRSEVTVITGARWRDAPPAIRAPWSDPAVESGAEGRERNVSASTGDMPETGVASGARRAAAIVGSRAREVILGYPFPASALASPAARATSLALGAAGGGEQPAPGETVVLAGDDVEAWVRERLYGGRPPDR